MSTSAQPRLQHTSWALVEGGPKTNWLVPEDCGTSQGGVAWWRDCGGSFLHLTSAEESYHPDEKYAFGVIP